MSNESDEVIYRTISKKFSNLVIHFGQMLTGASKKGLIITASQENDDGCKYFAVIATNDFASRLDELVEKLEREARNETAMESGSDPITRRYES